VVTWATRLKDLLSGALKSMAKKETKAKLKPKAANDDAPDGYVICAGLYGAMIYGPYDTAQDAANDASKNFDPYGCYCIRPLKRLG
jgi:hypothetical protein